MRILDRPLKIRTLSFFLLGCLFRFFPIHKGVKHISCNVFSSLHWYLWLELLHLNRRNPIKLYHFLWNISLWVWCWECQSFKGMKRWRVDRHVIVYVSAPFWLGIVLRQCVPWILELSTWLAWNWIYFFFQGHRKSLSIEYRVYFSCLLELDWNVGFHEKIWTVQ